MTLKELFEEHGQVWLALQDKPNTKRFRPLAYSYIKQGLIVGEDEHGIGESLAADNTLFVLYQPKPKTVKRAQYAYKELPYRDVNAGIIKVTDRLYKDDGEFLYRVPVSWFKRLEHTEIECPE